MTQHPGEARSITVYGTPVLHTPCAPVTAFDGDLDALIADMFASMYAAAGVGLAANQIGVGLRVFVYDCPDATGERHCGHVVNPVLAPPSPLAAPVTDEEGCLSVPGARAPLARPAIATVTGVDRTSAPITVSGTGTLARCLHHETDHLDGIVYVDHLDPATRHAALASGGLTERRHLSRR